MLYSKNERKQKMNDRFERKNRYKEKYPITLQFQKASKFWMARLMVKKSNFTSAGNELFTCVKDYETNNGNHLHG